MASQKGLWEVHQPPTHTAYLKTASVCVCVCVCVCPCSVSQIPAGSRTAGDSLMALWHQKLKLFSLIERGQGEQHGSHGSQTHSMAVKHTSLFHTERACLHTHPCSPQRGHVYTHIPVPHREGIFTLCSLNRMESVGHVLFQFF